MTSAHTLLVAVAGLTLATPAFAASQEDAAPTRTVAYHDLDLSSDAGTARLNARVRRAAGEVCRLPQAHGLTDMLHAQGCRDHAVAAVRPQLARIIAGTGVRVASRAAALQLRAGS